MRLKKYNPKHPLNTWVIFKIYIKLKLMCLFNPTQPVSTIFDPISTQNCLIHSSELYWGVKIRFFLLCHRWILQRVTGMSVASG